MKMLCSVFSSPVLNVVCCYKVQGPSKGLFLPTISYKAVHVAVEHFINNGSILHLKLERVLQKVLL